MKDYPVEQDETLGDVKLSSDGIVGSIYGNCPVQGIGSVDGHSFYFRARSDRWEFHIGPLGVDYSDLVWKDSFCQASRYGEWFDASWMSKRIAAQIIRDCVAEWRGSNQ